MQVWIVLKNGEVNSVFDTEAGALAHAEVLNRKWNITKVIPMPVYSI